MISKELLFFSILRERGKKRSEKVFKKRRHKSYKVKRQLNRKRKEKYRSKGKDTDNQRRWGEDEETWGKRTMVERHGLNKRGKTLKKTRKREK